KPGTQFTELLAEITDGEWVDPRLSTGLPPSSDAPAGPDPFAPPLRGILKGLTGTTDEVAAQAAVLETGAPALHAAGTGLYRVLQPVLRWPGSEVDEYLTLMNHNIDA